jgi:LysR family hydrogen peroxide-inducible transcriptional activator
MVAGGQAVTLIPELAVAAELKNENGLALVRFEPPEPSRTLGLVWRRSSIRHRDFRLLGQLLKEVHGMG